MISMRMLAAAAMTATSLSGCYVLPVAPDGTPLAAVAGPYPYPAAYPAAPVASMPMASATLNARLYPSNDVAAQSGMLAGTVVMPTTGKGRFQLDYRGETLVGEATRVAGNARAGVANAVGERGTAMSCTYTMTSSWQGTGSCSLSTGARYQVHLGT